MPIRFLTSVILLGFSSVLVGIGDARAQARFTVRVGAISSPDGPVPENHALARFNFGVKRLNRLILDADGSIESSGVRAILGQAQESDDDRMGRWKENGEPLALIWGDAGAQSNPINASVYLGNLGGRIPFRLVEHGLIDNVRLSAGNKLPSDLNSLVIGYALVLQLWHETPGTGLCPTLRALNVIIKDLEPLYGGWALMPFIKTDIRNIAIKAADEGRVRSASGCGW